jgi:hypothetical protein
MLERLARVDRTAAFLAVLALGLLGLFLPVPAGPILLYTVVAGLGFLLSRTWAVTPPPMRVVRIVVLAAMAALATVRLLS